MQVAAPHLRKPSYCFADDVSNGVANGRKSERTQARLRVVTCSLLEELSPNDLRVEDICREARVAHGTFYVYFHDIQHLLADTLTAFVGFMQSRMREAAKGAGADCVRSSTAAYVMREGRADVIAREELLRRAYALGLMVDQYLIMLLFGRDRTLASVSRDHDAVVATLGLIWERGMEP
jgi:TetR/AcrR family transcriptional regulator, ethionamide resistance regulator